MITAKQGQTVFDIALWETGGIEGAINIALLNGLSLSEPVNPGALESTGETVNESVKAWFNNNDINPATAYDGTVTASGLVFVQSATDKNNENTVRQGQCVFDLGIQTTGSVEGAFDTALLNNCSLSDALIPGTAFITAPPVDKRVLRWYKTNNIYPASVVYDSEKPRGINYMRITVPGDEYPLTDFIVS